MDVAKISDTLTLEFSKLAQPDFFWKVLGTAGLVFLVLATFKMIQLILFRFLKGRASDQNVVLAGRLIRYAAFTVAAMTLFNRLGIDLSALLGAAGIAGIAVGFAAQTSVSNVISGLFLISEKPFQVGDIIQVSDVTGTVQSIDFLSVKIQTFDNRFVRVPNETIIKSNVVNVTRYPIRRLDVWLSVSYADDLETVKRILEEVARDNVYVLDNPEPLIVLDKFDASGINILFGLWFERSDYLSLKNSIMIDVKKRFERDGVTIPFPRLDVRIANQGSAESGGRLS